MAVFAVFVIIGTGFDMDSSVIEIIYKQIK